MRKLPVPENIPLRTELWRGFGIPEAVRTGIITGIILSGCTIFCMASAWPLAKIAATMIVIFILFFCVGLFQKMDNINQSIYDYLRCRQRYRKEQQAFWYKREEMMWYVAKESETR